MASIAPFVRNAWWNRFWYLSENFRPLCHDFTDRYLFMTPIVVFASPSDTIVSVSGSLAMGATRWQTILA